MSIETSFYHGVPTSSNPQTLYIQVAAGPKGDVHRSNADGHDKESGHNNSNVGDSGEFWVSCPWQNTIKKMLEHPNLVYTLINGIRDHPTMKHKVLKILNGEFNNGQQGSNNMGVGDFNLPPSPTMAASNTQNLNLFSPIGNDSPGSMWSANHFENGHHSNHFRTVPVSFCLPSQSFPPLYISFRRALYLLLSSFHSFSFSCAVLAVFTLP